MKIPILSRLRERKRTGDPKYKNELEDLPPLIRNFIISSLPKFRSAERGLTSPANYLELVKEYAGWAYSCATRNASAVANVPLRLYRGVPRVGRGKIRNRVVTRAVSKATKDRFFNTTALIPYMNKAVDVEEVLEHPWLNLMREVNRSLHGFSLRQLTVLFKQVTGNAYWLISSNGLGIPDEIWVMPAHYVSIIPDEKKFIESYQYGAEPPFEHFYPKDVVHFKYPNPKSIYYGQGPMESAFLAVGLNADFDEFEKAILDNGAIIPFALGTDQPYNKEMLERERKELVRLHGGHTKAGKFAILHSGLKPLPLAWTPKDIAYEKGMSETMKKIFGVFGVPLSKVMESSNRAHAEAANYTYMKDTIQPETIAEADQINQDIMPRYDEKLFVAPDDCVPEDKEYLLKLHNARFQSASLTVNEIRQFDRREPIEGGDVALVPKHLLPLKLVANMKEPPKDAGGGVTTEPEKPASEGGADNEPEEEKLIVTKPEETEKYIRIPVRKCKISATITISASRGIKALYCGDAKKVATYLFAKSKGWTMATAREWVKRHGKKEVEYVQKSLTHSSIATPFVDLENNMERASLGWLRAMQTIAAPYINEFTVASSTSLENAIPWIEIERSGVSSLGHHIAVGLDLGVKLSIDRVPTVDIGWTENASETLVWARQYAAEKVKAITEETKAALRESIVRQLAEGTTHTNMAKNLREHIGLNAKQAKELADFTIKNKPTAEKISNLYRDKIRQRANMIARTETAGAVSEGTLEGYRQAGVQMVKWDAAPDACEICMPMHGRDFTRLEASGMLPMHPNCRCSWLPVIE